MSYYANDKYNFGQRDRIEEPQKSSGFLIAALIFGVISFICVIIMILLITHNKQDIEVFGINVAASTGDYICIAWGAANLIGMIFMIIGK